MTEELLKKIGMFLEYSEEKLEELSLKNQQLKYNEEENE